MGDFDAPLRFILAMPIIIAVTTTVNIRFIKKKLRIWNFERALVFLLTFNMVYSDKCKLIVFRYFLIPQEELQVFNKYQGYCLAETFSVAAVFVWVNSYF